MSTAYTKTRKDRSENDGYLGILTIFLLGSENPGGAGNSTSWLCGGSMIVYKHRGNKIRILIANTVDKRVK